MKYIQAFHVKDGDCLLIRGDDDTTILVDGGRKDPFREHVAPELHALDTDIDLLYISHIDNDHISGALELVQAAIDWIVFKRAQADPTLNIPEPKFPRPPDLNAIWHNGFAELVDDADGKIDSALANALQTIALSPASPELLENYENLTTGVRDALKLNYRLKFSGLAADLLNLPSTRTDNLMLLSDALEQHHVGDPAGGFEVLTLGPSIEDLEELRQYWNKWLDKHDVDMAALIEEAEEDTEGLGLGGIEALRGLLLKEATQLGEGADKVSEPNVASLTLLVRDGQHQILLTGDARSEEILAGLRRHGLIDDQTGLHVDVLKVQHHGAAGNVTDDFCKFVTADHYIFCANGSHTNPEKVVLDGLIKYRRGPEAQENLSPGKDNPFTFWFTTHSKTPDITASQKKYLESVEDHLAQEWGAVQDLTLHYPEPNDSAFDVKIEF